MAQYTITTVYLWNHRGRTPAHMVYCNGQYVRAFGKISLARKFVKQHGGTA